VPWLAPRHPPRCSAKAAEAWTPTTADYLMAHPMLADHLSTGMEAFGLYCED